MHHPHPPTYSSYRDPYLLKTVDMYDVEHMCCTCVVDHMCD